MILAYLHQKGGTGKSTLSIATALWIARRGHGVCIVDADSQGTSHGWGQRYGKKHGVKTFHQQMRLLSQDVRDYARQFEHVIIDLPPTVTAMTEKSIEIADQLLIPMRSSQADLWALDRLIALILLSDRKPPPPYSVVLTMAEQEELESVKAKLNSRRLDVLETVVPYSKDFVDLFEGGALPDEVDRIIGSILNELEIKPVSFS